MKKIFLILLAMSLFGMVYAVDGLFLGADFGIGSFDADPIGTAMGLRFYVGYEGAFMDDALTLDAEVGFNMDNFDDMSNAIDLEIEAGYYFMPEFGFHLNFLMGMDLGDDSGDPVGWLTPGLSYHLDGGFPMFFRADFPLLMMHEGDALDIIRFDFTMSLLKERELQYQTHDGFGAEIQLLNYIDAPWEPDFINRLLITPFYSMNDFLYFEAEIGLPLYENGMDFEGLTIIPHIEAYIPGVDGLSAYLKFPISNIGSDNPMNEDVVIGLGLGVKFAF